MMRLHGVGIGAPPSPSHKWDLSSFQNQERKEAGKEADGPEGEELALEDVGVVSANKILQFPFAISYEGENACPGYKMDGAVPLLVLLGKLMKGQLNDVTTQVRHQMQDELFLDVVVQQSATILQLLASKYQSLLVRVVEVFKGKILKLVSAVSPLRRLKQEDCYEFKVQHELHSELQTSLSYQVCGIRRAVTVADMEHPPAFIPPHLWMARPGLNEEA
ncbi:hypothetical protein STEG23_010550 [Scotinomys teguina]